MKFFLDTANVEQIKRINDLGLCDGVTTNPSIINKEGRDFKEVVKEIALIVDGQVSAEVTSYDYENMVKEARDIAKWARKCSGQNSNDRRRTKSSKYPIKRSNQNQLHPNLLSSPRPHGSKSRSNQHLTICRKNRRHGRRRHETNI